MLGQGEKNPQGDPEWKQRSGAILKTVKELEQKGYTFEGADASVDLMIRRSMTSYKPPFTIIEYKVDNDDERPTASRIQRWVGGQAGDYSSKLRKVARCKAVVGVRVDVNAGECDFDPEEAKKTLCDVEDETLQLEVGFCSAALSGSREVRLFSWFIEISRSSKHDHQSIASRLASRKPILGGRVTCPPSACSSAGCKGQRASRRPG